MMRGVTAAALDRAANVLGVDIAKIRAVLAVESRGSGYDGKGRLLILYEPHVLWRNLPGPPSPRPGVPPPPSKERIRAQSLGLAYPKWGTKPYPKDPYVNFLRAVHEYGEPAYRSASYGAPQLLGENFKACGYASAEEMYRAMTTGGESEHLLAMARFIRANPIMHRALKNGDWAEFARRYNGPGYAKNRYDTRLAEAYARFRKDPLKGLSTAASAAKPSPGVTMVEQARAETRRVVVTGGAVSAGTAATTATVAPAPPAQAPDSKGWFGGAGLYIGAALVVAVVVVGVIAMVRRNRPGERAPIIEQ